MSPVDNQKTFYADLSRVFSGAIIIRLLLSFSIISGADKQQIRLAYR